MGRAYRKHALDILHLLKKMQEGIEKAVRCNDIQLAGQLLTEMQEAAITLGTSIEAHIGEGSSTVKSIENYCELVYQLYEGLGEQCGVDVALVDLHKQLQQVFHNAEKELSNKYEMVFLPYKASMWDSLESVWRAADEDPDCDAYVMPIPYYDKNSDGTFRSEHYEGEDFPEDVPITHYLDYDLGTKHPDVVFIHNPYDDHNFVTSVHPYFYTEKLKEYAEKLVYIPYYISEESNPDSKDIIKGKSAMTLTNGVLHSDMIFLQSENTKRLFVNILAEYIPEIERDYWENRIWGLGSPKLDRVNRVVRDDTRLPRNWYDVIYAKSGLRKKVVFYNISISTLLKNPDMLNKIKDVLAFFKNRKDVALWWRPHPLYESTLASMRSDMLLEYQQIVNQYKQDGWGIFDEGVDLEWAIAETDAYYGDKSSVVQLYKGAGKPVMIQGVYVRTGQEIKAEDIPIWPSAFCVDGDDIWFLYGKLNVLMRYNQKEDYTYVTDVILNEALCQKSLYQSIYKWGNKIFLIPCLARELAIYNIEQRKFLKFSLKDIANYNNLGLFFRVYEFRKQLYCIPYYYKAVLKIDLESDCIEYIPIEEAEGKYISDATRVGNQIVAIYAGTNQVMILDLESEKISFKCLGKPIMQFTSIANIEDIIYLFDINTRSVVKVSGEENIEEVCSTTYEAVKMTSVFSDMVMIDSVYSDEMQVINAENKIIFQEREGTSIRYRDSGMGYYSGLVDNNYRNGENDLFYFSSPAASMYQFHNGRPVAQFTIALSENELHKLICLMEGVEDKEVDENDIYGLKTWIKQLNKGQKRKEKVQGKCGEKILQVVKTKLL